MIVIEWIVDFFLFVFKRERNKEIDEETPLKQLKTTRSAGMRLNYAQFQLNTPRLNIAIELYTDFDAINHNDNFFSMDCACVHLECDAWTFQIVLLQLIMRREKKCCTSGAWTQTHKLIKNNKTNNNNNSQNLNISFTYLRLKFHRMRIAFEWFKSQIFNLSSYDSPINKLT